MNVTGYHMVPREHRTFVSVKPSGGMDRMVRMVSTILSRAIALHGIRLDLDRLEIVAARTLRGNHPFTRVNKRKVSGNY